jgi:hypothetical protein
MAEEREKILRFDTAARHGLGRPHWVQTERELFFMGELIKTFQSPAENQELILAAFQACGWQCVIDNPLPREAGVDRQLEYTIRRLNRKQRARRLRFHVCDYGTKISWEPIVEEPPRRKPLRRKDKRDSPERPVSAR